MYMQHPITGEKIRIRATSPLRTDLLKQGYLQIEHVRTPAQIAATDRWLARGRLELAKSNLQAVIRDPFYQFTALELEQLKMARDVIAAKTTNFPMSAETQKRLRKEALSNTQ